MYFCSHCHMEVDVEELLERGICADCIDEIEEVFGPELFDGPDDLEFTELPYDEFNDEFNDDTNLLTDEVLDPDTLWGDGFGDGEF